MSLHNLAARLADLGRREDALAAIEEATSIRRELAARWPDTYHQELKQSLQVLPGFSTVKRRIPART
jgi:hypothetical protein